MQATRLRKELFIFFCCVVFNDISLNDSCKGNPKRDFIYSILFAGGCNDNLRCENT